MECYDTCDFVHLRRYVSIGGVPAVELVDLTPEIKFYFLNLGERVGACDAGVVGDVVIYVIP